MPELKRRKCSKCGEDLCWQEGNPCDKCSDAVEENQDQGEMRKTTPLWKRAGLGKTGELSGDEALVKSR